MNWRTLLVCLPYAVMAAGLMGFQPSPVPPLACCCIDVCHCGDACCSHEGENKKTSKLMFSCAPPKPTTNGASQCQLDPHLMMHNHVEAAVETGSDYLDDVYRPLLGFPITRDKVPRKNPSIHS